MRTERLNPADDAVIRGCYAVLTAAHEIDDPVWPVESFENFKVIATVGTRDRNPYEAWVAFEPRDGGDGGDGTVAGFYHLELPDLENRDRGFVFLQVKPEFRRHGHGRALLRHAAERAAAHGRVVLDGTAVTGSAGTAFAAAVGAATGMADARRILDLRKVPDGQFFTRLREEAAAHAARYRLVRWPGPVPEEYLDQVALLHNAMNDAPNEDGWDDESWDADRVRERGNWWLQFTPLRYYAVAALAADGEMAALTTLRVDPAHPDWAYQGLTAVTRPHRGHRLGLLVKTAMMEWIAEAEPAVTRVGTTNAPSNRYMIAVNETMGYELAEPGRTFYSVPVADVH